MTTQANNPAQSSSTPSSATPAASAAPATNQPAANPAQGSDSGAASSGSDVASQSDEGHDWLTDEAKQAMAFDPFTPQGDELNPTTNADGSPAADGGQQAQPASVTQAQPQQQGGTPQGQQPAQPAQPQAQQPVVYTQEQVTQLLNAVRTGQQPQSGTSTQQQGQGGQQSQPQNLTEILDSVPEYNYNVPDQLVVMLNSEDPAERKKALGLTIQGVAKGIHQTVVGTVLKQVVTQLQNSMPQQIMTQVALQGQQQQVFNDFYAKYPQLNTPQMRQLVHATAQQLAQAGKMAAGWTPEFRDLLGGEVIKVIAGVIPQQQQATNGQPVVQQNQPVMFGNGAAGQPRVQGAVNKTQADHMADVFN